jgi:uncharacterized membrane protein HdeD (DUF308 family)
MEPEILTKGGLLARGIFALIIGILCFTLPIGMQAVFAAQYPDGFFPYLKFLILPVVP